MSARAQSSPPAAPLESNADARIQKLEAEVAALRQDIAAAIAAQEQLNAQLRPAVEKLTELLRQKNTQPVPVATVTRVVDDSGKNLGQQVGRLESRIRSVEQRVERLAGQVTGILESRIWKTLVKGGSFFLKFGR